MTASHNVRAMIQIKYWCTLVSHIISRELFSAIDSTNSVTVNCTTERILRPSWMIWLTYSTSANYFILISCKGYGNCSNRSCRKMASMLSDGSDGGGGVFVAVAINGQPTTFRLSSSKLKFKEEKTCYLPVHICLVTV